MSLKRNTIVSYQKLIIFASILPLIIFGFLIYNNFKEERIKTTFNHIEKLNEQKKIKVIEYFEGVEFNIKELAKTVSFLQEQATKNITNIQQLQKSNIENYYHLIENDVLSLAKKDVFNYIFSFLQRGKSVDAVYLDNIYAYKEELGIKNVLMMDKRGKIIYSSDKKDLLNKNADDLTEEFQSTCKILKNELKDVKVSFVRSSYSELEGEYQEYAVAPFKSVDGYIAIEINQKGIQKIIQNVASLGRTAETYLVYEDEYTEKTYLASNRVVKTGKIGDEKSGFYIDKGFSSTGTDIKYGSLGDIELVGYTPVEINNAIMSMQTTVAYTEVISPMIKGTDYFEQFIRDYNYKNVMLIGSNGDIFYSAVNKKNKQTAGFSQAVKEVFASKKFMLTDIDYVSSSSNEIAQFALLPILKKDKSVQSIVVVELNLDTLSGKLMETKHIYKSYETYLVGEDSKLRSDTLLGRNDGYTLLESFQNNLMIKTQATQNILKDNCETKIIKDYRNISVISSYDVIVFPYFKWFIVSEVDEVEIEEMMSALKYTITLFVFMSSIIALILMFIITNEKKKKDEEIHYNATHDALTGLANRKSALDFLSYILANSKRRKKLGAVLYIDLDKFKIINDTYGHKAGDLVLQEISKRLRENLRRDDLIARLGGDEFILIINDYASVHDIDILCKKIIAKVSLPIKDEEKSYQVGISMGIATFPNDSSDPDELLQFSDIAMFSTKENGRNGFTYYSKEMSEKSLRVSRVESELKNAIETNELVLHYQPQVNLKTEKVIGVEALVRWNHMDDGLLMPDQFIPIAEEGNLILDLGYWVLFEACKTFQMWKNDGSDLEYIAVNMSAKQFQCPESVKNIQTILETLDFKGEWLELEITETALISNLEETLINIKYFRDMGIKFSIDDFGTGYSSLSYLKSLPISTLKIDREFIKDMIEDKSDRAIVEAIILMGHTLNYTIVAEGAQTKEEVELLKSLSCDIVQGYYYSKALPPKEVLTYIQGLNNAK